MSHSKLQYTPKTPFTHSRLQHEQQIENLYQEFESLKSQIYGFEQTSCLRSSQKSKRQRFQKDKAALFLQSSTIRKYELELANHLQKIHSNNSGSSPKKRVSSSKRGQISSANPKDTSKSKQFSKILSQYPSEREQSNGNSQIFFGKNNKEASIAELAIDLQKGQALFYQLINDSSKLANKQKHKAVNLEQTKDMLSQFCEYYLQLMAKVDGSIKFINQKLRCLELIFYQFRKIKKIEKESQARNVRREKQMVLDLNRIEEVYQKEIKSLTDCYERRIQQIEVDSKEKILRTKAELDFAAKNNNDSEKNTLKALLEKSKKVIETKEQLITSLQEENAELRKKIDMLSADKEEVILGYSLTANKIKSDMGHLSQIKKKTDRLANDHEGEEDDINFSELGSVNDHESLSEWDHSVDLQNSRIQRSKGKSSPSEQGIKIRK